MALITKYIRLAPYVLIVILCLACLGYRSSNTRLIADKTLLASELAAAISRAEEAEATLLKERGQWQAASLAVSVASKAQADVCRAGAERTAKIDGVWKDSKTAPRPEESIDEETSRKVIEMFNGSLFAAFGNGGLRR